MAQANIRAVITAEDRASATLKRFGGVTEGINAKIVHGAKLASKVLIAAAIAGTTFAIKSAAEFEQTRIGIENMLGSADKARALLGKISKFAAETPFEFPELAQATRQLIAFGFSADDAFKTMTQLGDVSAAIGAPMDDLAYLMGTLKVQGRAFMIDIRQFAQRGVPIYEYLAKVLNKNTKEISQMIEEGKIGFPQVQKAFQAMTAEGGKFHGTMAKQSKSLAGLFSTLKDNIGQTARELVGITREGDIKKGSILDRLRESTEWLIKNLPDMVDTASHILGGLASVVGTVLKSIFAFRDAIVFLSISFGLLKVVSVVEGMIFSLRSAIFAATVQAGGFKAALGTLISGINPLTVVIGALALVYAGLNKVLNDSVNRQIELMESQSRAAEAAAVNAHTKYQEAIQAFKDLSNAALGYLDVNRQLINAEKDVKSARSNLDTVTKRYGENSKQAKIASAELLEKEVLLAQVTEKRFERLKELDEQTLAMTRSNGALANTSAAQIESDLKAAQAIKLVMQARKEDTTQIDTVIGRLKTLKQNKNIDIITKVMTQQSMKDLTLLKGKIASIPASKTIRIILNARGNVFDLLNKLSGSGLTLKSTPGLTMLRAQASGGLVNRSQPYMVGENGPELFVPNHAGTVRKNSESGTGQVINVTFNGVFSSSQMEMRKLAQKVFQAAGDTSFNNLSMNRITP